MRHQCNRNRLGKAQDQRKALLRALATELFMHGEIKTTISRAKALKPYADSLITLAKKGDLNSRRTALKYIYDRETGRFMNIETKEIVDEKNECKKMPETVLRKLFTEIGKQYQDRNGGYTRIYNLPPRRGDATKMALIQLV
ncbi:50S ribosomal protein L17 [bacterium]|nr:50S ribosomal protein L17 [bacterium]